jgi:hypothetical protein
VKLLDEIRYAKKKLVEAKQLKCVCSGFYIQYEGQCDCERGKRIRNAESDLWNIINEI